jgi:hypothetical protein
MLSARRTTRCTGAVSNVGIPCSRRGSCGRAHGRSRWRPDGVAHLVDPVTVALWHGALLALLMMHSVFSNELLLRDGQFVTTSIFLPILVVRVASLLLRHRIHPGTRGVIL